MMSFDLTRIGRPALRALSVVCAALLMGVGVLAVVAGVLGTVWAQDNILVIRAAEAAQLWPGEIHISKMAALGFGAISLVGGGLALAAALRPDARQSQRRAEQVELQQSQLNEQLRQTAAQEERNRLARDLHDTIKQQLFSINVAAATAQSLRERDPGGAAQHIQQVRDLSQSAMVEMKALLTQLRPQPLATVGLIGAIEEQLDALRFRSEVRVDFQHEELPDETRLPLGAQEAIFRVVQEALANVARHARARNVRVNMARQLDRGHEILRITIADDGQGFESARVRSGMGLSNMRARLGELGGTLQVDSTPNTGTTIALSVPLQRPNAVREAKQRAKEARAQQVYLASGLLSFGVAAFAAFGLVVALFASGSNINMAVLMVILAVGAAFVLPLFLAAVSFRRRAQAGDDATGIWRALMRSYDLGQGAFLLLFAAWFLVSFRQVAIGGAVILGAVFLTALAWRDQRFLDSHIAEWATLRTLRTRLNEQTVFMAFGAIFIALVYLGVFGDIRQARIFHDKLDQVWFTSFLVFAYPGILLCSVPAIILLRRQIRLLKAQDGDQSEDAPPPITPRELRGQRLSATLYTFGFLIACAAIGPSLVNRSTAGVIAMIAVAVTMMILKMRAERALTHRVREWTTLTHQNSMQWLYGFFFAMSVLSMVSGLIGGVVGGLTANQPNRMQAREYTDMQFSVMLTIGTTLFASPVWLGLMAYMTRPRVQLLKQVEVRA